MGQSWKLNEQFGVHYLYFLFFYKAKGTQAKKVPQEPAA